MPVPAGLHITGMASDKQTGTCRNSFMNKSTVDLAGLIEAMEPVLHAEIHAFCVVPHNTDLDALAPVATMRETEGITVIVTEAQARQAGLAVVYRAAWITLMVHSDLHAVGLTAAFSSALARAGISCNVIAGAYHDHIFVPAEAAQQALAVLQALQRSGRA